MNAKPCMAMVLALGFAISAAEGGPSGTAAIETTAPAFRAVIPGVAVDSAIGHEDRAVFAAHLSGRVDGGLVVTGEVVNDGVTPITHVRVRVMYTSGAETLSKDTESLVAVISSDATGPFRVTFTGVSTFQGTLSAEVIGFEATADPGPSAKVTVTETTPFQIGPPDPVTRVIPYSTEVEKIRGTVTNTSNAPVTSMEVVLALYDGSGNVVFVTTSSMLQVPFQGTEENPVLLPGSTATFVAAIPKGRLLETGGTATWRGYLNATFAK